MKSRLKGLVFLIGLGALGAVVAHSRVSSASGGCRGAGYLCLYDIETSAYGNLAGSNLDWRKFHWNDRADWFKNDGRTSNVCVYQDIAYYGDAWWIPRDHQWYYLPNIVSSNLWVSGYSCPHPHGA